MEPYHCNERFLSAARGALSLLVLLPVSFMASAAAAQEERPDKPATPPPSSQVINQPVAIVMGKIITYEEVDRIVRSTRKKEGAEEGSGLTLFGQSLVSLIHRNLAEESDATLFWFVRKELASRILLVETARSHLPEISDEDIVRYWVSRDVGIEEDEIRRYLDFYKHEYFIGIYLRARMGLTQLKGVTPDYADYLRITPREIKEQWRRMQESSPPSATIRLAQFSYPKSRFRDPDELKRIVEECTIHLKGRSLELEDLAELAATWEGCGFKLHEVPEIGYSPLHEEILEFARKSESGEVSAPIRLDYGTLMLFVVDRVEPEVPTFEASQEDIQDTLWRNKRNVVRSQILRELIEKADYFPRDLFDPTALQRQPTVKEPDRSSNGGG